ncbi:MAG TPA: cytochrome P450 [Novosphingobium sp.]|nr:cytochrome P450 [Novosphingobium sp.]
MTNSANGMLTLDDENVLRNPFASYKWLRDNAPVYLDPGTGMYVITRYEDIRRITEDPQTFSSNAGMLGDRAFSGTGEAARIMREEASPYVNTMVSADPPVHTKYRAIVQSAFGPSRITKMQAYIQEVCDRQIETFADKGRLEVLADLAVPIPMYIIADQLGVPRGMYETFKRWSDALVMSSDMRLPEDVRAQAARSVVEMHRYIIGVAEELRRHPADTVLSDIVQGEVDGRKLRNDEIVSITTQVLVAGNETTTNTIAMGLHLMIEEGLEDTLRADLTKIPQFVEEVLRLTSTLQGLFRRATRDVEVAGTLIPEGAKIVLRWAAANRDERRFANPDVVDLGRKTAAQHVAFGMGIHYCLGNLLARAELRTTFTTMLKRFRNFRLADEPNAAEWLVHTWSRGLTRLALEFDPA